MSESSQPPSGNPKDPAYREAVVQHMIRESLSAKDAAEAYDLDARQVARWKKTYLQKLKTATKGGARKTAARSEPSPLVEDISRKPVRAEDARRPTSAGVFPAEADGAKTEGFAGRSSGGAPERAGALPSRRLETESLAAEEQTAEGIDQTLAGRASEISGQDRFSKNWERMGAGAAPLAAPPAPVRVNRRDRVITRLQDLPGVAWLLHGGRFAGGPWLLLLLIFVLAGAAYLVWDDYSDYVSPAFEAVPGETARYFDPLSRDEILEAENLITRFFSVRTAEEFEPLVRAPETVMPLIRRYYANTMLRPQRVGSFTYHKRSDMPGLDLTLHGVMLGAVGKEREIPTENTPDGPKVDWEVAVGYQPMDWRAFRRARPLETTYFRLTLLPSVFYGEPFDDPSLYRSYRLTYPGDLRRIHGYVLIDTEAARRLQELMPYPDSVADVLLGLAYPPGEDDKDLVAIMELRSASWVVPYAQGEPHFDVPLPGSVLGVGLGLGEALPGEVDLDPGDPAEPEMDLEGEENAPPVEDEGEDEAAVPES